MAENLISSVWLREEIEEEAGVDLIWFRSFEYGLDWISLLVCEAPRGEMWVGAKGVRVRHMVLIRVRSFDDDDAMNGEKTANCSALLLFTAESVG